MALKGVSLTILKCRNCLLACLFVKLCVFCYIVGFLFVFVCKMHAVFYTDYGDQFTLQVFLGSPEIVNVQGID